MFDLNLVANILVCCFPRFLCQKIKQKDLSRLALSQSNGSLLSISFTLKRVLSCNEEWNLDFACPPRGLKVQTQVRILISTLIPSRIDSSSPGSRRGLDSKVKSTNQSSFVVHADVSVSQRRGRKFLKLGYQILFFL